MFGFLRRKKPVEPATAPAEAATDQPAPVEAASAAPTADAGPPTAEAAVSDPKSPAPPERLDTPVAETAASVPPTQDSDQDSGAAAPAATTRQGFWSRFLPGGGAAERPAPAPAPSDVAPSVVVQPPDDVALPDIAAPKYIATPTDIAAPTDLGGILAGRVPPLSADAPTGTRAEPEAEAAAALESAADEPVVLMPAEQPDRKPWLARLKQGLSKTRSNIGGLFVGVKVDEALFEELETALLVSDAGVETTAWLLNALREKVRRERLAEAAQVKVALRQLLVELMLPLEQPIDIDRATPLVMMIAGVNGAGKTTSIGKLAKHLRREGKSVLLAAGDTFRAAAREQLAQWGSRNEVEVISQQGGDPAAVAFDAVSAGRARRVGVVLVDTAGRLPTQNHLMQELGKIRRVTGKAMPDAPHEVLLVLDGNTGQNMLAQVKAFDDAVQLTGLIVTKLDGTAKGGALAALAHTRLDRPIPVYFIGVGEGIDDLQAFSAEEFAQALVG